MARAHFVKKARKKNSVGNKGESYYWWKFKTGGRGGRKCYSRTPPRPSQLTQSDFFSALYGAQESFEDAKPKTKDDLESAVETLKSDLENLRDETQGKYDNLPDSLQNGSPGEQM